MDIPVLLWGDVAVHLPLPDLIRLGMAAPVIGAAVAPVLRRKLPPKEALGWMVPTPRTAQADHVALCRFLAAHYDVGGSTCRHTRHSALLAAIQLGWLEAGEWLATHLGLTRRHARMKNNRALQEAVFAGRLAVCQWLVERFHLTTQDVCADKHAALTIAAWRHPAVCQWLVTHFRPTLAPMAVGRMFMGAGRGGQVTMCEWLASHTNLLAVPPGTIQVALLDATTFFHWDVCRWLLPHFYGVADGLDYFVRRLCQAVRGRNPDLGVWLDGFLCRHHRAQENK